MILIITESDDDSSNGVIDWITFYNKNFLRLNRDKLLFKKSADFCMEFSSRDEEFFITMQDETIINPTKIHSVWFRRSVYPYLHGQFNDLDKTPFKDIVTKNLYYEYLNSSLLFFDTLACEKKVLGNFRTYRLNKLEVLKLSKKFAIDIPATLVTSRKKDVINFIEKQRCIISKPISEVFDLEIQITDHVERYLNYTEEVTLELLRDWPDHFFSSLFQEKLSKDIEIRSFFLEGEFFSMAIFSQLDSQTSVDFRKYTNNRRVPYKLPEVVERKLRRLMEALKLNCGSIDLVKTLDGRIVLLEINPTGQYGMTSYPCNYYLDKKICEVLLND